MIHFNMYRQYSPLILARGNDRNMTATTAFMSSLLQQRRNVVRRPRSNSDGCRRRCYHSSHHSATNKAAEYQNFSHHALTIASAPPSASSPPPPPPRPQHDDDDDPPNNNKLVFGQTFTPHMLQIHYQNGQWSAPQIVPYQNLSVSPAASSLHYGLQCFEGMKAYKPLQQPQQLLEPTAPTTNEIRLFRPDKNMLRLSHSMERLSMPGYQFDAQELIQCISTLVRLDEAYIPVSTTPGYALYLRPTVIATHPYLGLCPPEQLLLYVICSPVGPYYNTQSTQFAPVRLMTSAATDAVRAWPGGTGRYKVGGNYAGTMSAQQAAQRNGCQQVLWLLDDAVREVGSMNVFFVMKTKNDGDDDNQVEFITPPLSRGDILPGVTRDSILHLARNSSDWKERVTVSERDITMTEVIDAIRTGRLLEVFGAGTAAVVTAVQSIHHRGIDYPIPLVDDRNHHETWTKRVWDRLTAIQYGTQEGPPGWSVVI